MHVIFSLAITPFKLISIVQRNGGCAGNTKGTKSMFDISANHRACIINRNFVRWEILSYIMKRLQICLLYIRISQSINVKRKIKNWITKDVSYKKFYVELSHIQNMSKYDFLPINIEHAIQNIHKFSCTKIDSFDVTFHSIFRGTIQWYAKKRFSFWLCDTLVIFPMSW